MRKIYRRIKELRRLRKLKEQSATAQLSIEGYDPDGIEEIIRRKENEILREVNQIGWFLAWGILYILLSLLGVPDSINIPICIGIALAAMIIYYFITGRFL